MLNTSTNLIIKFTQSFCLCFAFGIKHYENSNTPEYPFVCPHIDKNILRGTFKSNKCYEPQIHLRKKCTKSFRENPNIRVFGAQHGFSFVFHFSFFFKFKYRHCTVLEIA